VARPVVEDSGRGVHRPCCPTVELPGTGVRDQADAVKAERDVRSLAQRVHASRTDRDLLATDAKDGGGRPCGADRHVNKDLVQIELVLVDHRPRSADATVLEARVEFGPDAHARSDMQIGVQQIALQEIPGRIRRRQAEVRIAEAFIREPHLAAER